MQTVDIQGSCHFELLALLVRPEVGWSANQSVEPTGARPGSVGVTGGSIALCAGGSLPPAPVAHLNR